MHKKNIKKDTRRKVMDLVMQQLKSLLIIRLLEHYQQGIIKMAVKF